MSDARIAWEDSHGRLWQGDVRACLAMMEPESVQLCVTSPPYWGLRAYGCEPQIWGGSPDCDHMLVDTPGLPPMTGGSGAASAKQVSNAGSQFGNAWAEHAARKPGQVPQSFNSPLMHPASLEARSPSANGQTVSQGATCTRCGAWRGELGSEPTVEQFVANLVEVFAAVRRVLRDDGLLWINLGSSYAGSGKGPTGGTGIGSKKPYWSQDTSAVLRQPSRGSRIGSVNGESGHTSGVRPPDGYKAKDLIQTPFLLFQALQHDGWWLRSVAPWIKRNGMPESCTDRPTHSLEWIGLFSKSERYFYDTEAGRMGATARPQQRLTSTALQPKGTERAATGVQNPTCQGGTDSGRNRRNTDWFFDGLDAEIAAAEAELRYLRDLRANGGVRLGDDGLPHAFDVNPQGFAGAHFATWSPNLVKPMIALSTSERGACAACGAPRRRVVERGPSAPEPEHRHPGKRLEPHQAGNAWAGNMGFRASRLSGQEMAAWRAEHPDETTGWAPTCSHLDADVVPCKVLDPFNGSGTSMVVARALGRYAVGIELNPEYCEMALKRLRQHVLF